MHLILVSNDRSYRVLLNDIRYEWRFISTSISNLLYHVKGLSLLCTMTFSFYDAPTELGHHLLHHLVITIYRLVAYRGFISYIHSHLRFIEVVVAELGTPTFVFDTGF